MTFPLLRAALAVVDASLLTTATAVYRAASVVPGDNGITAKPVRAITVLIVLVQVKKRQMMSEINYYWLVDGESACQSACTWGPDIIPPFCCSGSLERVENMIERFNQLRPGHKVEIKAGRCPESGRSKYDREG